MIWELHGYIQPSNLSSALIGMYKLYKGYADELSHTHGMASQPNNFPERYVPDFTLSQIWICQGPIFLHL